MEEYARLLEACLDQKWWTIITLARIGSLQGTRWNIVPLFAKFPTMRVLEQSLDHTTCKTPYFQRC